MWRSRMSLLPVCVLVGGFLSGCVEHQDRRLAYDEQTCQSMGHPAGSDAYKKCLAELNNRRCRMVREGKTGPLEHRETQDCSRLP